jgi:N,N'-diacetyllegionaminate synthase
MSNTCEIGGRRIGPNEPLFVIAEIGLNHGGSLARALDLVDRAADAGASAVKLQSIVAETLVAPDCPAPRHVRAASLQQFFAGLELDESAHAAVGRRARSRGLAFMATPFSTASVDMLERVGVDALKIASGDLTFDGLLERCGRTGLPVVLSTGMADMGEIGRAVALLRTSGTRDLALLHCVSAYPVPRGSENLRALTTLARAFEPVVGLSDHGRDLSALPVAVALGACIYERHIALDGDRSAVDWAVSSTPAQLEELVRVARETAAALGTGLKTCSLAEEGNRSPSRRGLRAARPLKVGDLIGPDDMIALRPATGLSAHRERELVGVRVMRDIETGQPFVENDLPVGRGLRAGA